MEPLLSGLATKQRLQKISPFISGNVLDIGCGWTILPEILSPDQSYTGVDIKQVALDYNIEKYPQHTFLNCNIDQQDLNLNGQRFSTVILSAVLEHLHAPERVLNRIHSLLEPDGLLILTTPSPLGDLVHKFGSQLKLFYAEEVVEHVKIFNQKELRGILIDCGYSVKHFRFFLLGLNQLIVGAPNR